MAKTEVYSWRVEPELKTALERAAREQEKSVGELLAEIAESWIAESTARRGEDDEAEQARLRAASRPFVGSLAGGDPGQAAEARQRLRKRLAKRHAAA